MTYNERLFKIFDYLKENGLIKTYVELSDVLKTNKAGINDLKVGNKKVSIEIVESMKKTYPMINLDWWILNQGEMILAVNNYSIAAEPTAQYGNSTIDALNKLIVAQEKTIKSLETQLAIKSEKESTGNSTGTVSRKLAK